MKFVVCSNTHLLSASSIINRMRKWIRYILIIAVFASCTHEKSQKEQSGKAARAKDNQNEKVLVLPWNEVTNPKTGQLELKYNPESNSDKLTVEDMIDAINLKYPKIPLQLKGSSGDTVKVFISNAAYLTQAIGMAGAETYLAEATFALTELKGVKAVNFSFKEGDHASPKTYSRKDFQK